MEHEERRSTALSNRVAPVKHVDAKIYFVAVVSACSCYFLLHFLVCCGILFVVSIVLVHSHCSSLLSVAFKFSSITPQHSSAAPTSITASTWCTCVVHGISPSRPKTSWVLLRTMVETCQRNCKRKIFVAKMPEKIGPPKNGGILWHMVDAEP